MTAPTTRREARSALATGEIEEIHTIEADLAAESTPRHARARRASRIRAGFGLLAVAALVLGGAAAVTAAVTGSTVSDTAGLRIATAPDDATAVPDDETASRGDASPPPMPVESLPAPQRTEAPSAVELCDDTVFREALEKGDDSAAITAAGGAELFRAAVASGRATCIPLDDPSHVWVVVNKHRPYDPADYRPAHLTAPAIRDVGGSAIEEEAAAALGELSAGIKAAGAGELGVASGFRSYSTQVSTYDAQVDARGRAEADLLSARPGFSEHQSGLAADVVACAGRCGSFYAFEGTTQERWVAEHAWEYGWIVRYEGGATEVTGYQPEPWHLRYIGRELAKSYHDGGWHTLEEFFGLAPAPDYAD